MKIVVSCTDDKKTIDQRFGRCPYYLVFETDESDIKRSFALANKRKKIQSNVRIHLEYGTIEIEEKNNEYTMVISVKKIATGEII